MGPDAIILVSLLFFFLLSQIFIRHLISLMAQMLKHLPTMQEAWVQSLGGKIIWRRKWQSIPVLVPGKSHGCKRVVGYSPWGLKESDTTEQLHFHFNHISNEIKRCLLFGRKVMTNLDSRFKSRDITLPKDVCLVKAMVFPVVIYGCESWTVKKAEHQRFDAFELWCWKRLLRVPWTARRSNQSILKEISPEVSLEGMMLQLKLQYFGHLMQSVDSLEKTLMLGGIGGRRRRG